MFSVDTVLFGDSHADLELLVKRFEFIAQARVKGARFKTNMFIQTN
jgi:hypothetical protein